MFHRYQTRLSGPAAGGVVKSPLSAQHILFAKSPLVKVCCHFKQRCYFGSVAQAMNFILVDNVPDDRPSLPITSKPCRPLADSSLYDASSCKGPHRGGQPIIRERLCLVDRWLLVLERWARLIRCHSRHMYMKRKWHHLGEHLKSLKARVENAQLLYGTPSSQKPQRKR